MSNYQFAPAPDKSTWENSSAFWEGGFTAAELDEIIKLGDALRPMQAVVGSNDGETQVVPAVRRSRTAWISQNHLPWLYDRMAFIARNLNGQFFDLDLYGFVEDMQFTVYEGTDEGHYSWHVDKGAMGGGMSPRKLSMVLQLSDPTDYEGGDLELNTGRIETAKKQRGIVYAFPSYVLHRVTPVTAGLRRTLVVWVAGPKFR